MKASVLNDCDSCLCHSFLGFSPGTSSHSSLLPASVSSSALMALDAICICGWFTSLHLSRTLPSGLHSGISPFGCLKLEVSNTELLTFLLPTFHAHIASLPFCRLPRSLMAETRQKTWQLSSTSNYQVSPSLSFKDNSNPILTTSRLHLVQDDIISSLDYIDNLLLCRSPQGPSSSFST